MSFTFHSLRMRHRLKVTPTPASYKRSDDRIKLNLIQAVFTRTVSHLSLTPGEHLCRRNKDKCFFNGSHRQTERNECFGLIPSVSSHHVEVSLSPKLLLVEQVDTSPPLYECVFVCVGECAVL